MDKTSTITQKKQTEKTNKTTTTTENKKENTTKTFEQKRVEKISDVSWDYDEINFSNLKWLNTEKYGNICIPSNWPKNKDIDAISNGKVITYGLPDVSQTVIMKDCIASNANQEIQSLLENLATDVKLEEWSYEKIKIGNKNAVLVNAKFNGLNHVQSTMFIATEDQSRMIVVSVEAPDPDVKKLLKTFTFEKIDDDATNYFKTKSK